MNNSLAEDLFLEDEDDALGAARATQQALVDTQERMGMMLDIMPMGLLVHTQQGILFANQEACRMLGSDSHQLVGQHVLDFVIADQASDMLHRLNEAFSASSDMVSYETALKPQGDRTLTVKLIASPLPWAGTPVIQILLQDVTDLKNQEERLKHLSITDELTGSYNRRHVFNEAEIHWDRLDEPNFTMSVLLMDVDHFKRINDEYGHGAGDNALVALTKRAGELVLESYGDGPVFARIGGEEFLLLMQDVPLDEASEFAEKLRVELSETAVQTPKGPVKLTMSIGVAAYQESDCIFDNLVSRCDTALYEAKSKGRDRVIVAR